MSRARSPRDPRSASIGSFSLFIPALERSLDASRMQVTLGPALMVLALGTGGLVIGSFLDSGRIRRVMIFGIVLSAASLATAEFWTTALAFSVAMGTATGWGTQIAPYLTGLGLEPSTVALAYATQSGIAALGTAMLGGVGDRLGAGRLIFCVLAMQAATVLVLLSGLPIAIILGAVVAFGWGMGGLIPLFTMLLAERLGPAAIGRAMGLSNLAMRDDGSRGCGELRRHRRLLRRTHWHRHLPRCGCSFPDDVQPALHRAIGPTHGRIRRCCSELADPGPADGGLQ